jgi:Uma2 family endonuclease
MTDGRAKYDKTPCEQGLKIDSFKNVYYLAQKFNDMVSEIFSVVGVQEITYSQFRQMEFDDNDPYQYELINGILMRKGAPHIRHQRISRRLTIKLDAFCQENDLGEVLYAPVDVYFNEKNVPQPDLVFIKKERLKIIDEEEGIVMGAPDILVEIISKGSVKRDRDIKKDLYARFGVAEYWLVDQNGSVEVFVLENGTYKTHGFFEDADILTSPILPDFTMPLTDIFGENDSKTLKRPR